MGDVVLSLPALRAIREKFPAANIAVLVGKIPGEVVKLAGVADEVIAVDRVELRDGPKLRSIRKILRFVREIRARSFDFVIDLHSLFETNILAFISTPGHRLLANRENRSLDLLSNFRPKPPIEDKGKHLSERYMDVLRPIGVSGEDRNFKLTAPESDAKYADQTYFAESRRTVGLFPGAGHPSRCWDLENFAELAKRFASDGFRSAVFLGPEEKGMVARVKALFPAGSVIIDGLSIARFVACARRLEAFVTNDTGPMHLAACAGAPIVLLLDGRAPTTYLPLTDRIEIVRDETIDKISIDKVYEAAASLIASSGGAANDKSAASC